jgi:hypothetical protein
MFGGRQIRVAGREIRDESLSAFPAEFFKSVGNTSHELNQLPGATGSERRSENAQSAKRPDGSRSVAPRVPFPLDPGSYFLPL